jgi:hypothetical protein
LNSVVYNQACASWNDVIELDFEYVNYDLNRDGKLECPGGSGSSGSEEMWVIIDAFNNPTDEYYDFFIVKDPSDSNLGGLAPKGYGFGFVFRTDNPCQMVTFAHELGHACFSFDELYSDSENIMYKYYNSTKRFLYKDQWDTIQDILVDDN